MTSLTRYRRILSVCLTVAGLSVFAGGPIPPTAKAIRTEASKPNKPEDGRPLPLAAHWHSRFATLDFQIKMIKRGHHILPFTYMLSPGFANNEKRLNQHTKPSVAAGMKQLAAWKLPFAMITGGQWKGQFYQNPKFWKLPPEQNPCVISAETGKPLKMYSPFGPIEQWRELGRYWGNTKHFKWLAEIYPDPPRVICVSNNEAKRLRNFNDSKRYLELKKSGKKVSVGNYLYERHRAMIAGLHETMPNEAWRKNTIFAAYNGGPGPDHMGREPGVSQWLSADWKAGTAASKTETPWRNTWEGALAEAYDNHWEYTKFDHHMWSCQVEMMNLVFMKERALQADPEWWMETIHWDGGGRKAIEYEKKGLRYTPQRYAAWTQYITWTLTPRVVRQWNGSQDRLENWIDNWAAMVRTVDLIHVDPVLKRFWRRGELVVNPDGKHPFRHELPEKYKDEDRWFHLSTNLDPPRPWELTTKLPVLTLARVLGDKPKREWLLYAHAPMGDRKAVKVQIPGYRDVTVDIPLAGVFYHLKETDNSITEVGQHSQLKYNTNAAPTAKDDDYAVVAGNTLSVTSFRFSGGRDLLRNDADAEGDLISAKLIRPPQNGELTLQPDGAFTYKPKAGFVGTDSFTYCATDGRDKSQPATASITVLAKPAAIVDDSSAGFHDTAYSGTHTLGYKGNMSYFTANPDKLGGATATWSFKDLPADSYDVFATWPKYSYKRPDDVSYTIVDGDEVRTRVTASQQDLPAGDVVDGVPWQRLATVQVKNGSLHVKLSNTANGRWVMADAIRIQGKKGKRLIVDNSDPSYSEVIGWNRMGTGYGGTSRWTRGRKVPKVKRGKQPPKIDIDRAVWTIPNLKPGTYELYATWPANPDGGGQVWYEVVENQKRLLRARAWQQSAPHQLYAGGVWWNSLGTITVTDGAINVVLAAATGKKKNDFIADAIAVFPARPPQTKSKTLR